MKSLKQIRADNAPVNRIRTRQRKRGFAGTVTEYSYPRRCANPDCGHTFYSAWTRESKLPPFERCPKCSALSVPHEPSNEESAT